MTLDTCAAANDSDLLAQVTMEPMLAGLATRRHTSANEPDGEDIEKRASSQSKSSVSRRFVNGTQKALHEFLGRDLSDLEAAVLMVEFAHQTCMVAMVITADGTKVPVGLRLGDTENATVVKAMLADLVERGLEDMFTLRRLGVDGGCSARYGPPIPSRA